MAASSQHYQTRRNSRAMFAPLHSRLAGGTAFHLPATALVKFTCGDTRTFAKSGAGRSTIAVTSLIRLLLEGLSKELLKAVFVNLSMAGTSIYQWQHQ